MPNSEPSWVVPNWRVPANVRCLVTTRHGGASRGNFSSFNLAAHVGDAPDAVEQNRMRLFNEAGLPNQPTWLNQVHGASVVELPGVELATLPSAPDADGNFTGLPNTVCAVLTADCLPLLLCSKAGDFVAAVHCGWRGVAAGIVEQAAAKYAGRPEELTAWLGPAISQQCFEVGEEVKHSFVAADPAAVSCFRESPTGRWLCDLASLVALRLNYVGVTGIERSQQCTMSSDDWYSHRRDYSSERGHCGRFASLIWFE